MGSRRNLGVLLYFKERMTMKKKMSFSDEGIANLMVAVMDRARTDYVCGNDGKSGGKLETRNRIEKWLRSDSAQLWILDCGPQTIIDNWRLQAAHQDWREKHKCSSCKNKKCVHSDPGHYTKPRICKGYEEK